jgi:hypothetical protein
VKGRTNYNPLAVINDCTGESHLLLIPSTVFIMFTEKEEEEERQTKLSKVHKEKLPRKIRKQRNVASKGRKSMYTSDYC